MTTSTVIFLVSSALGLLLLIVTPLIVRLLPIKVKEETEEKLIPLWFATIGP